MEKNRDNNFDLFRIVCCIAVIAVHASGKFETAINNNVFFGNYITNQQDILLAVFFNTASRFCVPGFVMLAGAFSLNNIKNANYRYYYKKLVSSIGVQVIIFTLLYAMVSVMVCLYKIIFYGEKIASFVTPIRALIAGVPYFHMWYLYMIVIIYILVPIILLWKKSITPRQYLLSAVILAIISICSGWTSTHHLNWDIGLAACYIGYFLLGDIIKEGFKNHKDNIAGILLIGMGGGAKHF